MKRYKCVLGALIMCGLAVIFGQSASASENYSYRVTLSGGKQGTVTGETELTMEFGDVWNPNDHKVTVSDSKYYFKGWHIAGQEGLVGTTEITQDTIFVAAYGIAGKSVGYTVNYVDAQTGEQLLQSETFYGNVGDKPVLAYRYIDTEDDTTIYQPQAYNLTKTLQEDESKNVFTFEYTLVEGNVNIIEDTVYQDVTVPGTAAGQGDGTGTGTAATAGGAAAAAGTAGGEAQAAGTEDTAVPQELIDLDNEDETVPQSNIDSGDEGNSENGKTDSSDQMAPGSGKKLGSGIPSGAKIAIVAVLLAGLAGLLAVLSGRGKRVED